MIIYFIGVSQVLSEMDDIYNILNSISKDHESQEFSNSVKVSIAYFLNCQNRNQRYLLCYIVHRLSKLRRLRWETGSTVVPDKIQQDTISTRENEYFMEYNKCLSEYFDNIGFDLTLDLQPPKELLIEVRVLESCGEIMTEKGPVVLDQFSTHFLRRSDVEHFIRQGYVQHVQNDEF